MQIDLSGYRKFQADMQATFDAVRQTMDERAKESAKVFEAVRRTTEQFRVKEWHLPPIPEARDLYKEIMR